MLQRFVEVMIGVQLDNLSNLISGNTYDMNSAFFLHKMWRSIWAGWRYCHLLFFFRILVNDRKCSIRPSLHKNGCLRIYFLQYRLL